MGFANLGQYGEHNLCTWHQFDDYIDRLNLGNGFISCPSISVEFFSTILFMDLIRPNHFMERQ